MNNEEIALKLEELEKRVGLLEFQRQLLTNLDNVGSVLLDYEVTENEYRRIMDVMDKVRKEIDNGQQVDNSTFENDIINIFGGVRVAMERKIEYHFCEYITKAFMDDGRWEEVFPALYGEMEKYKYLKE